MRKLMRQQTVQFWDGDIIIKSVSKFGDRGDTTTLYYL